MTNGTVVAWVCVVRSRLAGFGRHLDVEPAASAGSRLKSAPRGCGVECRRHRDVLSQLQTRGLALSSVAVAIDSSIFAIVAVCRRSRGRASDAIYV